MFDLVSLVKTAGYIGVAVILYAESGLLIGIVLPGDSLLFTAGFLASQGYLSIVPLTVIAFVAAVLGDNTGYWFGRTFGPRVFTRQNSIFLDEKHIERARAFYAEHGPKTIFLARFVPVVRTLAPILAGVGSMPRKVFMTYNFLGGLVWGVGISLAGYWLGSAVPGVDKYLLPIVALIIVVSAAPGLWHFLKERENRQMLSAKIRSWF